MQWAVLGGLLAVILLAAVTLRTTEIGRHFAHVDDIGVAAVHTSG